MIKELAERVVNWQTKKHFLADQDRRLYLYAYEILFNQIINILIAILLAVLFRAPLPVFVFLVSYIPLRSFCGGYHAKTNEGCTVVSAILICIVCVAVKIIPEHVVTIIQPLSFAISGVVIFRYAPVEDVNKPLCDEEIIRYRKRSRYIWLMQAIIGMVFIFKERHAGIALSLSHIILCVMLYWCVRKKRK